MDGSAPPDDPVEDVAPYRGSRDAAETLIGAVERAGDPWEVVRAPQLVGRELDAVRSWPVVLPHGELLGVITRTSDGASGDDELIRVLLRTFASLVAAEESATEVTRRAIEAEQEARTDPLTGLLNRRAWDDALAAETARMARHQHPALVLVIDVDGLKQVNDTDGHLAGDLLLRAAAAAMREAVREEDVVARIGGDEFAVLAVEADEPSRRTLLERVRVALMAAEVEASVGAAAAEPGASLAEAFEQADREMYAAKRSRKELAAELSEPSMATEAPEQPPRRRRAAPGRTPRAG
ncbi:MAG: GGDEF domain-containing protein [Acidimicrobiales bacterium]